MTTREDIVSKSRQKRIVKKVEPQTPILAQLLRERGGELLTEHVADVIEGAEMRIAARRMLNTPVPPAVSARLVSALFGGTTNPMIAPVNVIAGSPRTAAMPIVADDTITMGEIVDE